MSNYRVMVVDDEEEIREGIIRKIDWAQLGFTVSGSAENGLEALEQIELITPDLIMTDIKMPFMDGIKFIEEVVKSYPNMKIIIFSGYDDFEYAKRAISLNVVEYILKPISAKELTATLKKLKALMDRELEDRRDKEKLQKYYEESLPVIREQFLTGIVDGRISDRDIRYKASAYGLRPNERFYLSSLIRAENGYEPEKLYTMQGEEELMPLFIKQVVDEILSRFCQYTSFLYGYEVAVIGYFKEENDYSIFISCLNEAHKIARQALNVRLSAGIGSICDKVEQLRGSFKSAKIALNYTDILDEEPIVFFQDVAKQDRDLPVFGDKEEHILHDAVKLKSDEEIEAEVNKLFSPLQKKVLPAERYQLYTLEMFSCLLKILRDYSLTPGEVFAESLDYTALLGEYSLKVVQETMVRGCLNIHHLISSERMNSSKLLVEKAKEFINQHFQECDLSVEKICGQLYVSPAYFSTVFKKQTGQNFISYLTEKRLHKAIDLLNTTSEKTYIIAQQVGYAEPNYFSYVFKKKYGISPTKYRQTRT